ATEQFRQAIELLTKLAADYPAAPQYRAELARSHHGLGNLHKARGERSAAEESFRQALDVQSKLSADFPEVPQFRADLAEIHRNLGYWMEFGGVYGTNEEIGHVRRASELLTKLITDFPAVPLYRQRLASTLEQLATFFGRGTALKIENYTHAINHF